MGWKNTVGVLLVAWTCWASVWSMAEQPARIGELSPTDLMFMSQQRDLLQDIASTQLGRQFSGDKDRDLDLLQTLLDRQLVKPDQVRQLQAMGIILGDLLAAELSLHWVIYEDASGRSRALRYRESDNVLFPVTMIARRREADNDTPVIQIYEKAYDIAMRDRPALPFQ